MDRLSVKILKYIQKETTKKRFKEKKDSVYRNDIKTQFGCDSEKNLRFLAENGYISEDTQIKSTDGTGDISKFRRVSLGTFTITPQGKDFLEHRLGNTLDRYLNRISTIGSILGGALLSKPLWAVLDGLWNWFHSLCEIIGEILH